jgi:predicted flap endonuclease-1-like 5' DNA nuclease
MEDTRYGEEPMTQNPVDEPEVPLEAIVEPAPVLDSVEPDALPPETAIIEHVQLEAPETKPTIAIVDVEPAVTPPTGTMFARQPVAEIEDAAEKVANNIKEDADQIRAMLRTESAARTVDALSGKPSPQVITEFSKTVPEIAADVTRWAMRVFKQVTETAFEKVEQPLDDTADPTPIESLVETHDATPEARAFASAEEQFVDTQERSDAAASWVGDDDAAQAPNTLGENINLSDAPNPVVEGLPKPDESEFTGMADDLTVIEGIGPKMVAALKAAGIDTFARLAQASEDELRTAIQAAGMRLAPTLPTWAQQAEYAQRGDWEGLKTLKERISNR